MMAGGTKMARIDCRIDGLLFEIDGQSLRQVNAGDTLDEGQEIRTGKGSTALVRMEDGSRMEEASPSAPPWRSKPAARATPSTSTADA